MIATEFEQRLSDTLQSLGYPFALLGPSGMVLECNDALVELLECTREELVGKPLTLFTPGPDRLTGLQQQAVKTGVAKWQETNLRTKTGNDTATVISLLARKDDRGENSGFLAFVRDISARIQVMNELRDRKAMLRESEERYRELVENQGEGIGIVDTEERFVFANHAGEEIFGVPPGDLVGRSLNDLLEPEQMEIVKRQTEQRRQGRRGSYEIEIAHLHGVRRTLKVTAAPRFSADGKWVGTFALFMDITRSKQAEAELQESEEKYRNLVERANDGIVIVQDTIVKFANRRFARLLGYAAADIVGTAFSEYIHPDEQLRVADADRKRMAGEMVPAVCETVLWQLDGGGKPVELNSGIITYRGKPADLKFVRDITERKQAEDEIRAHSERLERLNIALNEERQKLLSLTDELTKANEELKRLSEMKSDFVAAASHELRTPLTTIVEGIRLTEDGSLGPVNEEQKEFLRLAREDALRLRDLIDTLLDTAKIERGKMQASKARVNVTEIAARIRTTYGSYARDKGLTLEADLPAEPVFAYCDAGHYHRVLANLVSNAVKFTSAGGLVTIRLKEGDDNTVKTSVEDTGVGIPKAQEHRIFVKFEQVQRPANEMQSGTGLGLALCKQLVELNDGTIGFESVEGEGSTFFFSLPVYLDQPPTGDEWMRMGSQPGR
jgi:PAS domain S-box-containing protein